MKEKIFKIVLPLGLLVLLAGAFYTGWYVRGSDGYIVPDYTASISNKQPSASTTADFMAFWNTWNVINDRYVATHKALPTDQERVWGAIEGMVGSLGDPYTTFFPPEEKKAFSDEIAGSFQGVGMEIDSRDGLITVISPLKDSPAEKAGMRSGDKILKIDGTTTADMSVERAVKLIRGVKGTTVKLTIYRSGLKENKVISITRDVINVPTVETDVKDGVFVIKLYNFYEKSPILFRDALQKFVDTKSDKLVIDLRGNPGGFLDAAVSIASWFLPEGTVVVKEDFGAKVKGDDYRSAGYNIFTDKLKLAILINGGSASASEILAGALHDHGKAILVGTNSFGKGSVQEIVQITPDTSLKVTIARWLTPKGVSISEGGLKPDFEVKMTDEDITNKKDPQLDKAIELITK